MPACACRCNSAAHARSGSGLAAMHAALDSEWLAMLLLVICASLCLRRQRRAGAQAQAATRDLPPAAE
ncbi:hypothetical protein ATB53_06870 [Xanthomonas translucens]|uniref:Uncharacterized protein n=1 Tax=Xanthomonas campestris pv. translucens TaxID=343 RepID=A0A125PUQ5_XANCT|nr:hypothetical protein ATB53_06870 [Xanthomonas translucens]OAX56397.1 hypothetical protein A6R79_16690 [Xanthomonas translucens pv. translucens]